MFQNRSRLIIIVLLAALAIGQVLAFVINPAGYQQFIAVVPVILSQIAFWGPLVAILAGVFSFITLRLLGFQSLDEIRTESVDQNNPTPAIIFVGTLIASLLLLTLVIRP
jgi:hypothetical protein